MAFGKSASSKLAESADSFVDFDKNLKKFLIAKKIESRPVRQEIDTHNVGGVKNGGRTEK